MNKMMQRPAFGFMLLLAFMLFPRPAEGQTTYRAYKPEYILGASGGFVFSSVIFKPSVPQTMYKGFETGILARVRTTGFAAIQAEIGFARRGWQEDFEDKAAMLSYNRQLTFVQMPILSHFYYRFNRLGAFFNLGAQFGYMLSSSSAGKGVGFTDPQTARHNLPVKHLFAWGLCGGPGLSLCLGRGGEIELEGRFYYGFNDLFGNSQADLFGKSSETYGAVRINYLFSF